MDKNLLEAIKSEIVEVKSEDNNNKDIMELACGGIIISGSCGTTEED